RLVRHLAARRAARVGQGQGEVREADRAVGGGMRGGDALFGERPVECQLGARLSIGVVPLGVLSVVVRRAHVLSCLIWPGSSAAVGHPRRTQAPDRRGLRFAYSASLIAVLYWSRRAAAASWRMRSAVRIDLALRGFIGRPVASVRPVRSASANSAARSRSPSAPSAGTPSGTPSGTLREEADEVVAKPLLEAAETAATALWESAAVSVKAARMSRDRRGTR